MIYNFITISDPITFLADDEKIAFCTALLLGEGKAGCEDETGKNLQTMYMFDPDPMPKIAAVLGEPFDEFIGKHLKEIADCLKSFAYGDFESRKLYDEAIIAITDEAKLTEFKKKHEDRNRTSLSKWVKCAWSTADGIYKKIANKENSK